MVKRRTLRRIELDNLVDGFAMIRVPTEGNGTNDIAGAWDADDMVVLITGNKPSGQHVHVEARVPRSYIPMLAHQLHRIIDLEEKKTAAKRAAMKGGA